jgi:hypothetical protein
MSQRPLVRSDHFKRDTVTSGRHRGESGAVADSGITKGREGMGSGDHVVVKGAKTNFAVNMTNVKATLAGLRRYATTPVSELTPEVREDFHQVLKVGALLYETAAYEQFLTEVSNTFHDVQDVKPGDVAALLYGCFISTRFPGSPSCDPRCTGGLPPPKGTQGWEPCKVLSLLYQNGKFISLNDVKTETAYITVMDPNFKGFTDVEITELSNYGIQRASVIRNVVPGEYNELTDFIPVKNLPKLTTVSNGVPPAVSRQTPPGGNNSGVIWAVVIIIVILIIILLIGWQMSRNRGPAV